MLPPSRVLRAGAPAVVAEGATGPDEATCRGEATTSGEAAARGGATTSGEAAARGEAAGCAGGTAAPPGEAGLPSGDTWVRLTGAPLSTEAASAWVSRHDCGAIVVFAGCVRDYAEGRPGVSEIEYEAYSEQVEPRLSAIAASARRRWPSLGRLVLWHRTGTLGLGECSVLVAVSAPHRGEAFEACRYCIDALKSTVPIWKRERWSGGEDWGLEAHDISDVAEVEPW